MKPISEVFKNEYILARVLEADPSLRAEFERDFKLKRDPRITPVGRFLRRSSLDELPQLFNVIKGEMAIIGPRPERPEFTQFLAKEIPGYVGRLSVKPGITGLAQIILPADSDLESVQKKLDLDLEYVRSGTLILDIKIAFCTAIKMVGLRSSDAANWLGVMKHTTLQNIFQTKQTVDTHHQVEAEQECAEPSQNQKRKSVSLNELVQGVSAKQQVDSSVDLPVHEGISESDRDADLQTEQLAEPSGHGSIKDPDSGPMGSFPS